MDELYDKTMHLSKTITIYAFIFLAIVILAGVAKEIIPKIWARRKASVKVAKRNAVDGIVLGKKYSRYYFSPTASEGHVFVTGGTGKGKTSAILIPSLRHWTGNTFVIDLSGDIEKNVHTDRKLCFTFGDPSSAQYDVFAVIDAMDNQEAQDEALAKLAYQIMPDLKDASGGALYFHTRGRQILTAALIHYYHQGLDFPDICSTISTLEDPSSLFREIAESGNAAALKYIASFRTMAEDRDVEQCVESCHSALLPFTVPTVLRSLRRAGERETAMSPFSLEKYNCYLRITEDCLDLLDKAFNIIVSQVLTYIVTRPEQNTTPILIALDEFAGLGKLESILSCVQRCRKKHARVMILTQSMADLDLIYGKTYRMAMLPNFDIKVVLSAADVETAAYYSDLIGKEDKKQTSTSSSSSFGPVSTTTSSQKDYIVSPQEFGQLGNHLIVIAPEGHYKLKKAFYFKEPIR